MNQTAQQWIIRLGDGTLKGPLFTHDVQHLIREGGLTGQEQISKYPDSVWMPMSQVDEFYDAFLEALEVVNKPEEKAPTKSVPAETIFMPLPPAVDEAQSRAQMKQLTPIIENRPQRSQRQPVAIVPRPKTDPVIELKSLQRVERAEFMSALKIPLILFLGAFVLLGLYFMSGSGTGKTDDKISLLAPGKPGPPLPEAEVKKRYAVILSHVAKDTFEDSLEAQNKLVSLIESAPTNLEIRGMLCVVYKDLWPYAKQDTADQKTLATFVQSTRVLDVGSSFGTVCEAIKLMTGGRFKEARANIEAILEKTEAFSFRPIVYALKAELLEADKDFQIAIPYYEKASQDWPEWVKPRQRLAFTYTSLKEFPKSLEWFQGILTALPNHKSTRIGLAITEYVGFKKFENAFKNLSTALYTKGRVPRPLESEGWQIYADLLLDRGQKSEALTAAKKAYSLNPSNSAARQLVVRLGGSDKLSKEQGQNNELVFMGDQYVRQGDCLSAQAEFKAAYELDPKNSGAALKAAKCLWQLHQSYEAIDWLTKAIKADPKAVSAYALQADYMAQRYDFTNAAQALANASRVAPGNHELLKAMALLELRKNNMTGAIIFGQRAMKAYDADPETYVILSKANLQLAMGIQSTMKKDVERRESAYRDAVRFATKAVEFDPTNTEAQIAYSRMLNATNGTDVAAEYLRELIKKYSYSSEYRLALAEVFKLSERWNEARALAEQVTDSDLRNKKAWLLLGEAQRATGQNDAALMSFLKAAAVDPTDGEGLFQAGRLYIESNRFEDALQQFVRVRNMNPNFPRASYYAGKAAFSIRKFDEAMRFATDEKRVNPSMADAYLLTAEIYAAQGGYQQCAKEYSQAIKLRPSGAEIYVKAAQCYRQAGSLDIADTMLTLAYEKESGYPELYRELGAMNEKKNAPTDARESYLKYLELAPNAPDRADIESRLSRLGGI